MYIFMQSILFILFSDILSSSINQILIFYIKINMKIIKINIKMKYK